MPVKLDTSEFLRRAILTHKDKYDYSKTIYINKRTKVCITCREHGDFWQLPLQHIKGSGCPVCGKLRHDITIRHPRLTLQENIDRIIAKQGDRYDFSQIPSQYSLQQKYPIICKRCGNTIYVNLGTLLSRVGGCKYCKFEKQSKERFGVPLYQTRRRRYGVNDAGEVACREKSFAIWEAMVQRCCDTKCKEKHPSYENCTICNEWLQYSEYKKWYNDHYMEGFDIDKDILCYGTGKEIYSPDTCCFVPPEMNYMMTSFSCKRKDKHVGVYKRNNSYLAIYSRKYLGSFDTEKAAILAYVHEKKRHFQEITEKWKDYIDPRVYYKMQEIIKDIK